MVGITAEAPVYKEPGKLYSHAIHVLDRTTDSHREAGLVRVPPHKTHTVASEATLACSGDFGKDHPFTQSSSSTPGSVVRREKCTPGSTVASPRPCPSVVYQRLERRLGHTVRGVHCKRRVFRYRSRLHIIFHGIKGSHSGPQELRASLQASDCVCYEIRLFVSPPLEDSVLVPHPGIIPRA